MNTIPPGLMTTMESDSEEMMKSYERVLPRDLFNEANLLKCLGQVSLLLHDRGKDGDPRLIHWTVRPGFDIQMDMSDGSIFCSNLTLHRPNDRHMYYIRRVLNSRDPWPIYLITADDDTLHILDDDGQFSPQFKEWARF